MTGKSLLQLGLVAWLAALAPATSQAAGHAPSPSFPPTVPADSRNLERVFHLSGIMAQLARPVEKRRCDEPCGFLSEDSNELTRAQFNIIIEGLATEFSPELAAMGWRVEAPPRRIVLGPGHLGPQTLPREAPLLRWRSASSSPFTPPARSARLRLAPAPIPKP